MNMHSRLKAALASFVLGLAMLLMTLALPRAAGAQVIDAAAAQNKVQGSVLIDAGGPAAGAIVIALQDGAHASAAVDAAGAYTLSLTGGDWQITVRPPAPTLTSPNWIYADGPQRVSFSGHPDPISPTRTLNFTAAEATATLTGTVTDPSGGTNFSAPNRVWVRAGNQEGRGNTVLVDPATGMFSVNLLPNHNAVMRLVLENSAWAPPAALAGSEWYVGEGETQSVGNLQLLEKQAVIGGQILNESGQPVTESLPVRAWRLDGSEVAASQSTSTGSYSLTVISGTWAVRAVPPLTASYVTAQSPQKVVLISDTAAVTQDLRVATVDVIVNGTIVDGSGTPITAPVRGRAYALYRVGRAWPQLGPSVPITQGQFTLRLASSVAVTYRIGAYFPPNVGYTALAAVPLTVTAGGAYTVTLPVAVDNSTISGHFNNRETGEPQTGLPGAVFAASVNGGSGWDRVNPRTGGYSMTVATTNTGGSGGTFWRVRGYVDPTTGYVVQPPRRQRVFIPYNGGQGADVTVDFTVARLDAVIGGRVTDAQGQPLAGAIVSVHEVNAQGLDAFVRWTLSGQNGLYALRVPAGTYEVRARHRGRISPVPQIVTVASGGQAQVNLQFRAKNALISGRVLYEGSGYPAFVRAYSSSGAHAFTLAGPNGLYALAVNAGEAWHLQAVSEAAVFSDGITVAVFLRSPRVTVTPSVGANPGISLTLQAADRLPDSLAFSFDAGEDQAITLSDGSQVIVPAGALAESGQVVLAVRALPDLADDGGARPVSFGYRLLAFGADRMPITRFNLQVTLAVPFTAEQLAALGVTADDLVPSYWDTATSSWKPVPDVTVLVDETGGGTVNFYIDHFTDFALLATSAQYQVHLPVIVR